MKPLRTILFIIGLLSLIGASFVAAQEEDSCPPAGPDARAHIRTVIPEVPSDSDEQAQDEFWNRLYYDSLIWQIRNLPPPRSPDEPYAVVSIVSDVFVRVSINDPWVGVELKMDDGQSLRAIGRDTDAVLIRVRIGEDGVGWIPAAYVLPGSDMTAVRQLPVTDEPGFLPDAGIRADFINPFELPPSDADLERQMQEDIDALTNAGKVIVRPSTELRLAPSEDSPVIPSLSGVGDLFIADPIGRNDVGAWILIRTVFGDVGWIPTSNVMNDEGQLLQLPVVATTSVTVAVGGNTVVRSEHAVNSVLETLPSETTVEATGRSASGNWLYVRTPTGTVGWIHITSVLDIDEEALRQLPYYYSEEFALGTSPLPESCGPQEGFAVRSEEGVPVVFDLSGLPLELDGALVATGADFSDSGVIDTLILSLVDGTANVPVLDNPLTLDQPGQMFAFSVNEDGNAVDEVVNLSEEQQRTAVADAAFACMVFADALMQASKPALDCSPFGAFPESYNPLFAAFTGTVEIVQQPAQFPAGAVYPIAAIDGVGDSVDCNNQTPVTAEPGTFPDILLVESAQVEGVDQIVVRMSAWQPQEFDYFINQFSVRATYEDGSTVAYFLATQNSARVAGGQVGADTQAIPGTEEMVELSDDGLTFTVTFAESVSPPQQLTVVTGSISKCDDVVLDQQPLLTPQEVDALIARVAQVEQIAGAGMATVSERAYSIPDLGQCISFIGGITPPTLAGNIIVRAGNDPSAGPFVHVSVDAEGQATVDASGGSARMLVRGFDGAQAQTGAAIVEYGNGEYRIAPTQNGVTSSGPGVGRRGSDGISISMEVATEEAVIDAPSSDPNTPPTFMRAAEACPGYSEVM